MARPEKPSANTIGITAGQKPRVAKNPMKTAAGGKMLALEPRILLDAAIADTAAKIADAVSHDGNVPHIEARQVDQDIFEALAPVSREHIRREVIFVDAGAANLKDLLDKATPNRQVVVLSPNHDGVVQITRVLSRMQNVDAVHIFSHGDAGRIQLGKGELSIDNIRNYQKYLKAWAAHMSHAADIMIYGCDVAQGAKGADFVRILSELTQADVAASTDLTGAASQGGDWVLETVVGRIETDQALSVHGREQFEGTLATHPTNTSGALGTNLVFDGTDDFIKIADASQVLTNPKIITVEAWVKTTGATVQTIASTVFNNTQADQGQWDLLINTTGKLWFEYKNNSGSSVDWSNFFSNGPAVNDGNWHHVAVTRNGTAIAFYVDGVVTGQTTSGVTALTGVSSTNPLYLGGRDPTAGASTADRHFFNGQMDEVRIWNTARSAGDIAATTDMELAAGTGGASGTIASATATTVTLTSESFSSLVGYWKLNQETGTAGSGTAGTPALDTTVAKDYSANASAQNGVLTNFNFDAATSDWANTPPVLAAGSFSLTSILEDAAAPQNGITTGIGQGATLVSSLVGSITDNDTLGSTGIAITGINAGGTLYYSTNTGSTWAMLASASDANALVLTNDPANLLYFKPDANVNGSISDAITYRAWDGTGSFANATAAVNVDSPQTAGSGISRFSSASDTVSVAITSVNDAPTLTATGTNPGFTEGAGSSTGTAVTLFSGGTATFGADSGQFLDQLTLTLSNVGSGGADELSFDGGTTWINMVTGQTTTAAGTVATKAMTAAVSTTGGTATVVITVGSGGFTEGEMNSVLNTIQYRSTSNDPTAAGATRVATLTTIRDTGGTANSGVNSTTVSLASTVTMTDVNDAPTASTLAGLSPTFTEGAGTATGTAVALFGSSDISTVETGQNVDQMIFTVSNLSDGSSEVVNIDGSAVTLTNGTSVPSTATNGMTVSVAVSGSTATITVSKAGGISTAAMNTLVNGITYENQSQVPTANASRVATITSLRDSGGSQTGNPAIASTITVAGTNDAPTMTLAGTTTVSVGTPEVLDGTASVADVELDAANSYNGATLVFERQGGANANDIFAAKTGGTLVLSGGNVVVDTITVGTFTHAGGTLTINFDGNATSALVDSVIRQIAYDNATDPGPITLDTVFNDGALSVTKSIVVTLTTGSSPTITGMSTDSGSSSSDYITNDTTPTLTGTVSQVLVGSQELRFSTDGGTSWTRLSTQPGGGTSWTTGADIGTLAENTYSFQIGVFADANLATPASTTATQSLVIDATGPATTVATKSFSADTGTSSTDFITKTAAQTISGTLSGVTVSGEIVQVSLDNGATWATATNTIGQDTWSLAGQTLTGSDTLQVRVLDTAGNAGPAITQAYVLDTTAPAAPANPLDLATASDSGSSTSDNTTRVTAPSFRVDLTGSSAAAGDSIELLLGGSPLTSPVTATLSGTDISNGFVNLSVTDGDLGADGNKTLTARITDLAGNIGTAGGSLNVTLDTTAPTVTDPNISITSTPTGAGSTYIVGDTITAQWTNTGGDANIDIAGVTMDFSAFGGGSAVVASNSAGIWTASYTLAAGSLNNVTSANVAVTATDNAGNSTTQADSTGPTVDNQIPTSTISGIDISADTGASNADFITKTAAQTITATLSSGLLGGEKLYGSIDGGSNWTDITAKVTGTAVSWDGATLGAGTSSIRFKVTDAAGSDGAVASQAYTLDATAPTAASVTPLTTSNSQPTITGTFDSASIADGGSFTLSDGTTYTLGVTPGFTSSGDTWTLNFATAGVTLADGGYDYTATTTDAAGNIKTDSLSAGLGIVFVDSLAATAPTVTAISTNSTTPVLSGTAPALITVQDTTHTVESMTVSVGGATYNVTPSGGTWSLDLATATPASGSLSLVQGVSYAVSATITDATGNAISDATTNELVIGIPDTTAPSAPTVAALTTNSAQPIITGSFNAADHAGGFTVTVDGTTYTLGTDPALTNSGDTWSLNLATAGQTLPEGAYSITATARDAANNTSNGSGNLIIDHTAPVAPAITGPLDGAKLNGTTTTVTGTGEAGATMRVYDTDGTTLLGTTTVASSGIWSLANVSLGNGDHTLHAKQTDAAGNVSPDKLVSFNVSSVDPSTLITGPAVSTTSAGASAATGSSGIGVADAGTPVMDTVQESLAQVATQKIDLNSSPGDVTTQGSTAVDTTGTDESGEQGAAQKTLNNALNTPSSAGPARQGVSDSGRPGERLPVGDRNSLNVADALRGQIVQISPDSFEILLPASAMNVGDIIYMAVQSNGQPLPDYIEVDPVTGKVTINRDKAPLGVNRVDIKLTRIVQNGALKDVKSASVGITVNKEARVNVGENRQPPVPAAAPQG